MRKKVFYKVLTYLLCVLSTTQSFSQERIITGTVADEKGSPLPGATVTVRNLQISATTDFKGKFQIKVPPTAKSLVISYVGMQEQEVSLGKKIDFSISLRSGSSMLSDVVVIGYGTQKRGDVNGAISSISSKDIADVAQPNIDQMLQGRLSGVTVTQNSGAPGAAVSVRVRGITSFSGSEPLYVIDGVIIDGNAPKQANSNSLAVNISPSAQESNFSVLSSLNPNDIESIDVLKDASASAIYGSRAANGVIIITTKKGKSGQGKLGYDGYYGSQTQGKFLKMMNLPQYASFENNLANLFQVTPRVEFSDPSKLGPGTNWQKAIFSTAPETNNTLSFSGSNNKTDYYVSGGYFDQTGTIVGSNFRRYSIHAGVNSQVKDWFKMGTSISANQNKTNVSLGNSGGIIYNALLEAPDAAVYNADGTFAGPVVINGFPAGGQNPIQQASIITNYLVRTNVQGSLYGDLKFLKDFTMHSEIDGNFDWTQTRIFSPTYSYGATGAGAPAFSNSQAALLFNNDFDSYWSWVEHLNYNHTFAEKHNLDFLVAHEVWESNFDGIDAGTKGFIGGNTIQTLNLGTQSSNLLGENKGSQSMESEFARAIYTYDNRYSISGIIRRDRSSNFAQGHQIGNFPGVAVSWKLTEEKFLGGLKTAFSNLKLRLGYGTVGNANIGQYKYGSAIQPAATGLGTAFLFFNLSNPNLTWETAIQQNVGVDFGVLNNRIEGSVDLYKKTSKNFLFQQPLPAILVGGLAEYSTNSIVQPPFVNAGQIENTGIEFNISSHNITQRDFTWTTSLVFSHYTNKVVSLNGFPALIGQVSTGFGSTISATRTVAGGPIGEFYGYKTEGIIKTQAQLDDLAAHPQNVNGVEIISSDRTKANAIYTGDILYAGSDGKGGPNQQYNLGNPNPDFTYSIGNNLNYKDFGLSIFLVGSHGGKILNAVSFQTQGMYSLYQNQLAIVSNYWTPANPNSSIPTPRNTFGSNNTVMSDRFLESASYLRIQNVRFDYNLPTNIAHAIRMSHLKAYVSAQNLYVFTKYSGLDPEVGSQGQNPILQNIDYGRYPTPRLISFGLNAEF
jgi:TonB-linked SusC/RagA family outer membrane protein